MTPAKRIFDIALALLLGLLLLPVLGAMMALLYFVQGRPVFYGAERMRTTDQGFTLWKLRSMRVARGDSGVSGGDKAHRITPLGRWMRQSRLDELPQLWNVLRGDISFVGPRPPLRQYVERCPRIYAKVLKARPGITGLATLRYHDVEERLLSRCTSPAETDRVYVARCIPRKAQFDMIYQQQQSLCLDIALLVETAQRVLTRLRRL